LPNSLKQMQRSSTLGQKLTGTTQIRSCLTRLSNHLASDLETINHSDL
jgi:hypothetical protein